MINFVRILSFFFTGMPEDEHTCVNVYMKDVHVGVYVYIQECLYKNGKETTLCEKQSITNLFSTVHKQECFI